MFKVGDRGKTRRGNDYVITSVDGNEEWYGIHMPITALVNGRRDIFTANGFCYGEGEESDNDLLPPNNENSANAETPFLDMIAFLQPIMTVVREHGVVVKYNIRDQEITISRGD